MLICGDLTRPGYNNAKDNVTVINYDDHTGPLEVMFRGYRDCEGQRYVLPIPFVIPDGQPVDQSDTPLDALYMPLYYSFICVVKNDDPTLYLIQLCDDNDDVPIPNTLYQYTTHKRNSVNIHVPNPDFCSSYLGQSSFGYTILTPSEPHELIDEQKDVMSQPISVSDVYACLLKGYSFNEYQNFLDDFIGKLCKGQPIDDTRFRVTIRRHF